MPITAESLDGKIIPFPNETSHYGLIGYTILALIAFLLNLLVLLANRSRFATPNSLLILSLCLSDSLFSLTGTFIGIGSLSHDGFDWGKVVCLLNSFMYEGCCCVSALTLAAIALERYLTICRGTTISFKHAKIAITAIWIFVIGLIGILELDKNAGSLVVLMDSVWYCNPYWISKKSPLFEISLVIIAFAAIVVNIIPFCYLKVYQKVKKLAQDSKKKQLHEMERLTFFRSISVTGAFFTFWTLEFLLIGYEFITGKNMPSDFYMTSILCILLHCAVNPILIVLLDKLIQRRVLEFLNLYSKPVANPPLGKCEPKSFTPQASNGQTQLLNTVQL